MTHCFVGIGSNESPEYHCQAMIKALREQFGDIQVSHLLRTSAFGIEAPDYVNAVVHFEADITQPDLKNWCRQLEQRLGRVRGQAYCRADLDILYLADTKPTAAVLTTLDDYYQAGMAQLLDS